MHLVVKLSRLTCLDPATMRTAALHDRASMRHIQGHCTALCAAGRRWIYISTARTDLPLYSSSFLAHLATAEAFNCTMAEAAGLVVGGAGLLALFEACVSGFERVDTGK